ncbi:AAA family ATPase [Devosia sp.]|uniref:AAA family ATPase n=1 Tax=Devosia sp. TaxID=1871048 RepID=UPI003A8F0A28
MDAIPPLAALGPRIMVCGPSNAGKSTLAAALAQALGVPAIYLDVLAHQPHTSWVRQPPEVFEALHADAIAGPHWVIEGNYMGMLQTRMARATGIILLGTGRWAALTRYVRRTLFETRRIGSKLEKGQDRLNWEMVHFIMVEQPRKRQRDVDLLTATGLPMVKLDSMAELKQLYAAWRLSRPR